MTTGPEAFAGGAPEQPQNPNVLVPNPVLQERVLFDQTLARAAEFWAPGPGSAAWENWPDNAPQPVIPIPGLVRIGSRGGQPVLTPLVGERHLVIGNPALLVPSRLRQVRTKEVTLVKTLKEEAEQEFKAKETLRRRKLEEERAVAISVAQNVVTRSVASMPPGSVDLTVIDPRDRGQAFRGFAPMGRVNRFRVAPAERTSALLRSLDEQIIALNSGALGGHRTLRSEIRHKGVASHPWQIVVLLGHNQLLNLDDSDRLRSIMQQGAEAGITMIIHGFDVQDTPQVNRLSWDVNGHTRTTTTLGWQFQLDPAVPESIMSRTAVNATRPPTAPYPTIPRLPPAGLAVSPDTSRVPLPGANYSTLLDNRARGRRAANETMRTLRDRLPLFTGNTLTSLGTSAENYPAFADQAAREPNLARHRLSHPEEGSVPELAALESWAMLQLLARTPGHTRDWLTQASRTTLTTSPETHIPLLIDAVEVTRWHGQHLIPEQAREYVLQYLGDDPPAYAFQLVADLGDAAGHRMAVKPYAREARDATIFHLEQTYNARLRNDKGVVHERMLNALIECEILRLYDFQNASPELQVLLAQRAHERFAAVDADALPADAQKLYAACQTFLTERGGPLLTKAQKTGRAAGDLAARATSSTLSWAKNLGKKKETSEEAPADTGPAQIEQEPAATVADPASDEQARDERLRRLLQSGPQIFRPDEKQPGENK